MAKHERPPLDSGAAPAERDSRDEDRADVEFELTVLMPCLNEAETLEVCINKARNCMREMSVHGEVLISDNGSTDGSQEIARRCGARVIDAPIRGYGGALQAGIAAARSKYIIMADADDSYDFSGLQPFVEKLRAGHDLVMGNRFRGGIAPGAMPPLHRYLGNPVLSFAGRLFFSNKIGDFHCGLRGFSKQAARRMDLQTSGMEFASEMVVRATLLDMNITEVPTTLSPDGRSRPPHLRSWRDGWRHLRFLLMFSPRWLFFYPGLLLMATGLVLVLLTAFDPLDIRGVVLDIHTMLYATAMVLTGFQAVLFSVFTNKYCSDRGLMPCDPMMDQCARLMNLESGVLAGAILLLTGLIIALILVFRWWQSGFGNLDPVQTMRPVIASTLLLALGAQIVFSSFFLHILGLTRRRQD